MIGENWLDSDSRKITNCFKRVTTYVFSNTVAPGLMSSAVSFKQPKDKNIKLQVKWTSHY